jgi:hypothetical protein
MPAVHGFPWIGALEIHFNPPDDGRLTTVRNYHPGGSGKSLYIHPPRSTMIYSFISQEFNELFGINPDYSYERESRGNTFDFYLDGNYLIVEEIEYCYDDKDVVNTTSIALNKGDQIIAASVTGLTLIKLTNLGIKVSLLDSKLVDLPLTEQTEDIKARIVYSLVSLDD